MTDLNASNTLTPAVTSEESLGADDLDVIAGGAGQTITGDGEQAVPDTAPVNAAL